MKTKLIALLVCIVFGIAISCTKKDPNKVNAKTKMVQCQCTNNLMLCICSGMQYKLVQPSEQEQ